MTEWIENNESLLRNSLEKCYIHLHESPTYIIFSFFLFFFRLKLFSVFFALFEIDNNFLQTKKEIVAQILNSVSMKIKTEMQHYPAYSVLARVFSARSLTDVFEL